jgi:GntR family transcriptional regulator/MocR family aminotransferase
MPKRAVHTQKPEVILDQHAPAPLYKQLYERLRAAILAGQLEAGARLPSTRGLASELGISRNTTALAYELLLLEGYLESRVGDGTRVAHLHAQRLSQTRETARERDAAHRMEGNERPPLLARRNQLLVKSFSQTSLGADQPDAETGIFRVGQPDVSHFPYETWARLMAKHARQSLQGFSLYQPPQGYLPLREAIAAHVGITRGVHCSPEQIIITAGSQGALDLVARVLLDPGEPAWVENPGYVGAHGTLLAAGAQVIPVSVDQDGLIVEVGRQRSLHARLAVVTPSHQFPTAVPMSLERRLALLEWSRDARAWIIEDDYDSEYRFSGRPLESLQGLDDAGRVIYIGSFSKVLFPSLRLGYLIVPPALLEGFITARSFIDVHPPLLEQMALAEFIAAGHYARHLRKMRLLYLERRDALVAALRQELGNMLHVVTPEAGIHLVAWLPAEISAPAVTQLAVANGLHISPISQFSLRPLQRDGLLFGFAGATADELRAGVRTLAQALRPLCV